MTDTITITKGRPNRQGDERDFAGPDGTYEMTLVTVSEPVTEKSNLPDAKNGEWTYRTWTFAVSDGGEFDGQVLDVRANARSTGPKSKQYGVIVALFGRTPPPDTVIDIQRHLVGRSCYAQILTNDNEFPFIASFMPLPAKRGAAPVAPAPAPVAVPAPARPESPHPGVPADQPNPDDLPF